MQFDPGNGSFAAGPVSDLVTALSACSILCPRPPITANNRVPAKLRTAETLPSMVVA